MTNNATIETAKVLTFGTELEYTNITREKAAKAIHSVVGGTVRYYGGGYDAWQVTAPDGRIWKAVSDGSLTDRATSAEVVTPILKWDDMETLQAVVRALRKKNSELHKPARPRRRERLQRPPDRQHRADFLQAGRADFESRRNP